MNIAKRAVDFKKTEPTGDGTLGFTYRGETFVHHSTLQQYQIAFDRLSRTQAVRLSIAVIVLLDCLAANWHATITGLVAILTFLYALDMAFNLWLILRGFRKAPEITISKDTIQAVPKRAWPTYTILCPLYHEAAVLPQFIEGIGRLDYDPKKLQILLLLEEDDAETIQTAKSLKAPARVEIVIVPHSKPKTKPKACNYGLLRATGEYIVIYDAEDIPDPLQLKKAVIAFRDADERVACIQSKLNFYNPHQNYLTKFFTAEYSLWFDLVLTGLYSLRAPIPLGGTSNHFRTKQLRDLGGWDAFNVTEDADLGIRLAKAGLRTAILHSTTLEEANSHFRSWFYQRRRWIKGYIQTYLVHTRKTTSTTNQWKRSHAVMFRLIVGGKVASLFINPILWITTISYFAFRPLIGGFIQSFYPAPVLYIGTIALLFGNFLYIYYYMLGCAKHNKYSLVKYSYLIPFYWLMMSAAAWMALYELITSPHYWNKTTHGLHLGKHQDAMAEEIADFMQAAEAPEDSSRA